MLLRFGYPTAIVIGTVLIHAGCTHLLLGWFQLHKIRSGATRSAAMRATVLSGAVSLMALVACLESALWAVFYVTVGALPSWSDALYFSMVTFTSLGYGDVTLGREWRLTGAFEAANGIIMFGWTTALIVAVVQTLFREQGSDATRS